MSANPTTPTSPKRILIVNLHSALNLGDDAIMQVTVTALQQRFPEAQIALAANDPNSWKRYEEQNRVQVCESLTSWVLSVRGGHWHISIPSAIGSVLFLAWAAIIYRVFQKSVLPANRSQANLIAKYYEADLVISCGGGNFSAHTKIRPFFIWGVFALAFALALGKPVVMLPQSFGPIEGCFQRFLARKVFERARTVMVREPQSLAFLKNELRLKQDILLFPDLAFGLSDVPPKLPKGTPQPVDQLKVGITLMDRGAQTKTFTRQAEYEQAILGLIRWLIQEKQAHLYLLIQCYGPGSDHDDRNITQRMVQSLSPEQQSHVIVLDTFQTAKQIKAAYACMDFVIGTRMHTGILAMSVGVPTMLIGYQPKTLGVMEWLGLKQYCVDMETLTNDALIGKVKGFIESSNAAQLKQSLERFCNQLDHWITYL